MKKLVETFKAKIHRLTEDALKRSVSLTQSTGEWIRASAQDSWLKIEEKKKNFDKYIQSEDFEKDLDRLAEKLNLSEHPKYFSADPDLKVRVRTKVNFIYQHSIKEVFEVAGTAGAVGGTIGKIRAAKALSLLFGLAKTSLIGIHIYDVFFAPKATHETSLKEDVVK